MTTDRGNPVYVAGAFEHPTRKAPDKSTVQLHAEAAHGALDDGTLEKEDVDAYLTAGIPEYFENRYSLPALEMADYLGLDVSFCDTTDFGGSADMNHVGHACKAIRSGVCDVGLVTMAARPRSKEVRTGTTARDLRSTQDSFERIYGTSNLTTYGMAARRHMHEYGTTAEQLAAIRVAASRHAQYNDEAMYRDPVTIEDVVNSRVVADPLHLLDCCVISDGAGALVVVSDRVRERIDRECVEVLGHGEAVDHHDAGRIDLTYTGARKSGRRAYEDAGVSPDDVDYVGIYDSFTITALQTIEDLGFCAKGEGGAFVEGGTLEAPDGDLPFNTDGGSLCSNHPNRGGMTKIIEAVRQLRRETAPEVQVDADVAVAHGTGGDLATRHGAATLVLGRDDR